MKYAIIIPDGCADETQPDLNDRTPLAAASIPAMDEIARRGIVGESNHVPERFTPGSEVANLSLLGYDPHQYFTGRAPIEAAAKQIELSPDDWAIRCNLVCIQNQIMRDFTAGHISTEESRLLLAKLQAAAADTRLEFITGISYRHLLIYRGEAAPFSTATSTTAPHDLTDLSILDDFPRGPGSHLLVELMDLSSRVFADDEINRRRRENGKTPATHVWLWGLGKAPRLTPFAEKFGLQGAMITAVDLLRGLARLAGWDCIEVPGATGYLDTDYAAKGQYAVEAFDRYDIVCVHVEAPDEASHEGQVQAKMEALEQIDRHIVQPIHRRLQGMGDYRILITPDHPTLLRTKMHSRGMVPWCACGAGISADAAESYSEKTAAQGQQKYSEGWRQMEAFLCR